MVLMISELNKGVSDWVVDRRAYVTFMTRWGV